MAKEKTLEDQVLAADRRAQLANIRLRRLRDALRRSKECTHKQVFSWEWEWDSGYGEQTKKVGKTCVACGMDDPYSEGKFQ